MLYAAAIMIAAATQTAAQETVLLHAAGSLRGALTEATKAFEAETGLKVDAKYGPSGLLRKEVGEGAKAGVLPRLTWSIPKRS
jgi:ABC-type molybdate transport system substrate-binding protein